MEEKTCNTLPKKERLCGKTAISQLLAKGRHGNVPNMRYLFMKNTGNEQNRILISVPKKLFKRAVKRNLLKRRIRESYRKQKHNLAVEGGLDVLFMYSTKEVLGYQEIYEAIGLIIERINSHKIPGQARNDVEGSKNGGQGRKGQDVEGSKNDGQGRKGQDVEGSKNGGEGRRGQDVEGKSVRDGE